jgi:hypothetical protein
MIIHNTSFYSNDATEEIERSLGIGVEGSLKLAARKNTCGLPSGRHNIMTDHKWSDKYHQTSGDFYFFTELIEIMKDSCLIPKTTI